MMDQSEGKELHVQKGKCHQDHEKRPTDYIEQADVLALFAWVTALQLAYPLKLLSETSSCESPLRKA